jgi:hypothetical protein
MSILDTFTILFNSNSDEVDKGAEIAARAGKKLEEQLGSTDAAAKAAAEAITQGNAEAASSFAPIGVEIEELKQIWNEAVAGINGNKLRAPIVDTTEATAHLNEHIAKTHEAEEANGRFAESFDKLKEHGAEAFKSLLENVLEYTLAWQALLQVEKLGDDIFEQAEKSDQLGEQAKSLGIAVEDLSAWGEAVKRVGGTAEGFAQSLEAVNRNIERGVATGHSRALPFFKELGVSMTDAHGKAKPLMDLLPQLAEAVQGKSHQESSGILRSIGFDEGTIRLLQSGQKETEELVKRAKELGLVTKEDAETAEKFNREWMDVKQSFSAIAISADTAFLPALESILEAIETFISFLRAHKDFVTGFFYALAAAAVVATVAFGALDFAALPWIALAVGIGAVIVGLGLLYDDIVQFTEGNNSLIGVAVAKWPLFGLAVEAIGFVFRKLNDVVEGIFGTIGAFASLAAGMFTDPTKAVNDFWTTMEGIYNRIIPGWGNVMIALKNDAVAAFGFIKEYWAALTGFVMDLFTQPSKAFGNLSNAIVKAWDELIGKIPELKTAIAAIEDAFMAVGRKVGEIFEGIGKTIARVLHPFGGASPEAIASGSAGPVVSSAPVGRPGLGAMSILPGINPWAALAPDQGYSGLAAGKEQMAATQSPLLAQTTASISASKTENKNVTVTTTVGPTTINTQSTDPAAIKSQFDQHLDNHLDSALNHYADGMSH